MPFKVAGPQIVKKMQNASVGPTPLLRFQLIVSAVTSLHKSSQKQKTGKFPVDSAQLESNSKVLTKAKAALPE